MIIRRDGDQVIWSDWRNPAKDEVGLPEFRFDARQYRTEAERVTADHSWEWPARTVARPLQTDLEDRTDRLARWECELEGAVAWPWEPDQIGVFFFHPQCPPDLVDERPWLQFLMFLPVSGDDPAEQAGRLAEQLVARDPREAAEICGGSPEAARRLGYPWPQQR